MECRDLSNNNLTGDIPVNGSFSLFTPIRFVEAILFFFFWKAYVNDVLTDIIPHFAVTKITV